jgi:hypothetical protein
VGQNIPSSFPPKESAPPEPRPNTPFTKLSTSSNPNPFLAPSPSPAHRRPTPPFDQLVMPSDLTPFPMPSPFEETHIRQKNMKVLQKNICSTGRGIHQATNPARPGGMRRGIHQATNHARPGGMRWGSHYLTFDSFGNNVGVNIVCPCYCP